MGAEQTYCVRTQEFQVSGGMVMLICPQDILGEGPSWPRTPSDELPRKFHSTPHNLGWSLTVGRSRDLATPELYSFI
jgi:hypothetical protein